MAWSVLGRHDVFGSMPWRVADRPRLWRSVFGDDLPFVTLCEWLECERSRCVLCGRDEDLEWCRLMAGFSGGGISDDSIGTSTDVDGGGVVSMAAVGE